MLNHYLCLRVCRIIGRQITIPPFGDEHALYGSQPAKFRWAEETVISF